MKVGIYALSTRIFLDTFNKEIAARGENLFQLHEKPRCHMGGNVVRSRK